MIFSKINPLELSQDICERSISSLSKNAKRVLNDQALWVPDEARMYPAGQRVLLLGGFLNRILESGNWPAREYELWTCSSAVKNVMTQIMGFADGEVGVLNRYDLFPLENQISKNESLNDKNLVFAGRLSPSKNLEALIYTVYFLQKEQNLNVGLHFFGKFDNHFSADRGRWDVENYAEKIHSLISSLDWKQRPVFHGYLEQDEWIQTQIQNPVYFNLSTFMSEDFDVSLAQTQQKNWPAVLSTWGGHLDVNHSQAILIPWRQIGRSDESADVITLKSKALAQHLATTKFSAINLQKLEQIKPIPVSKNRLDELRMNLIKKMGSDAFLVLKESLAHYADTGSGKKFFSLYQSIFGKMAERSQVVITNDLNLKNEHIRKTTHEIVNQNPQAVLISYREALLPDNVALISNAQELHLSFSDEKFKEVIQAIVPEDCLVQVYS